MIEIIEYDPTLATLESREVFDFLHEAVCSLPPEKATRDSFAHTEGFRLYGGVEESDMVAAAALFHVGEPKVELELFAVRADRRRERDASRSIPGVGSEFLRGVESRIAALGAVSVVVVPGMTAGGFYESNGYRPGRGFAYLYKTLVPPPAPVIS